METKRCKPSFAGAGALRDRFIPGHQPSARTLNELAQQARRASVVRPADGGGAYTGPGGVVPLSGSRSFVAEITSVPDAGSGSGGNASGSGFGSGSSGGSGSGDAECPNECPRGYGFRELVPDACGEWVTPANPVEGDGCDLPLYALGNISVGVGDRVWVHPGDGTWFWFDVAVGGDSGGLELDFITNLCVIPADAVIDSGSGSGVTTD